MVNVGDNVWYYESNVWGAKNYREHFKEVTVDKVGRKYYYLSNGVSVPIVGSVGQYIFTTQQMEDNIFINEHRWKISDKVKYLRDADKLRRIVEILKEE